MISSKNTSHEAMFAPLEKRFFHTMECRRAKTFDLTNIGPQPGLNFLEKSRSEDTGGVGDSIVDKRLRSSSRKVFVPKKGALKRKGAIRKKKNEISPKIQRLREKARSGAKKQDIIGTNAESFDENEEKYSSKLRSNYSNETDRPVSELRRHAFF